jgi:hypothetical protein
MNVVITWEPWSLAAWSLIATGVALGCGVLGYWLRDRTPS